MVDIRVTKISYCHRALLKTDDLRYAHAPIRFCWRFHNIDIGALACWVCDPKSYGTSVAIWNVEDNIYRCWAAYGKPTIADGDIEPSGVSLYPR